MKRIISQMFDFKMSNVCTVFIYCGDCEMPVGGASWWCVIDYGWIITDLWAGPVALGSVGGYDKIANALRGGDSSTVINGFKPFPTSQTRVQVTTLATDASVDFDFSSEEPSQEYEPATLAPKKGPDGVL